MTHDKINMDNITFTPTPSPLSEHAESGEISFANQTTLEEIAHVSAVRIPEDGKAGSYDYYFKALLPAVLGNKDDHEGIANGTFWFDHMHIESTFVSDDNYIGPIPNDLAPTLLRAVELAHCHEMIRRRLIQKTNDIEATFSASNDPNYDLTVPKDSIINYLVLAGKTYTCSYTNDQSGSDLSLYYQFLRTDDDQYYFAFLTQFGRNENDQLVPLPMNTDNFIQNYMFPRRLIRTSKDHDNFLGPYNAAEIDSISEYADILGETLLFSHAKNNCAHKINTSIDPKFEHPDEIKNPDCKVHVLRPPTL